MKSLYCFLLKSTFIAVVLSHSHLECTNVDASGKCLGYGRYYSTYKNGYKGTDES